MPKLPDDAGTLQNDEQVQDVDSNADGGSSDDGGDDGQGGDEYYLTVNDRTRYKTQEDARAAFQSANERIAQLSGWEKELSDYGVTDPRVARQLFDELISLRQFKTQAEQQAKDAKAKDGTPTETHTDAGLSGEELKAFNWIKGVLPKLGYVPKAELEETVKALKAELETVQQGQASEQAERRELLIEESRGSVVKWMADAKLADNEEHALQGMIEGYIRDWINSDDKLVRRFYAGGSVTNALVKEGFDRATKALGMVRSNQNTNATYVKNKTNAQARNPKRLPQPGLAGKGTQQRSNEPRKNSAGKVDHIANAHDAAWEAFQSHNGSGSQND